MSPARPLRSPLWEDSVPFWEPGWGLGRALSLVAAGGLGRGNEPSEPLLLLWEPTLAPCTCSDGEGRGELYSAVKKASCRGKAAEFKHKINGVKAGLCGGWDGLVWPPLACTWLTSRPPLFQIHDWEGAGHLPGDWG